MHTNAAAVHYKMRNRTFVVRDTPEHIDFHIKTGDYFDFIATAIGLFEEALGTSTATARERALAQNLRRDLRYVNATYKIVPKTD
ncbi:hypothetical protein HY972_02160 [Candidatus Kaiserbacteria bacterium]|nr:hypothetical protein [Candidatus Kaiserbacteria bacterium]